MQTYKWGAITGGFFLIGLVLGVMAYPYWLRFKPNSDDLISPFVKQEKPKPLPLLAYSIPTLAQKAFEPNKSLTLLKTAKTETEFYTQTFAFTTTGKYMSGLATIPKSPPPADGYPVLLLIRGYVPPEIYAPGVGTKSAGEFFAKKGFVTLAPDFLGYGTSDPDVSDSWESRFIKPIQVIELLKTIQANPVLTATDSTKTTKINPAKIGIWAHSNGGQITLTALEILQQPIPTTLWAPVLAPFPYSLLYFSDENADEGKASRNWIAQFERDYDVFDFSLTQHLNLLHGEFQLHHGTADDSALKSWSDEFLDKVKKTNQDRDKNDQIKFNYFVYPGGNHNMQPGWDAAISRDWEYFQKQLKL